MTDTNNTNFDAALKQIYRPSNLAKLTYKRRPLLGMLPKFEGFGGRNMPVPILYGNPQGRSATFATAQSNATQVLVEDFLLTRVSNYAVSTITGEVIETTRGDNMAFLRALKTKIDSTMNVLSDDWETALFRDTNGHRAQTGSVTNADPMVITLLQTEEITNFDVGMVLIADATATGATPNATPASVAVAGISRSAGTLTTDYANDGTTTDWAANDYLFVSGDQSAKIAGLASWFPGSAPGATSFFGVDRTTDDRLSGTIHDGSGGPVEEAGIDAQSKVAREGGGGGDQVWLMHHGQMRKLIKELGGKKEYTSVGARGGKGMIADIGYAGVRIYGDTGEIKAVACNKAQALYSYILQLDVCQFATIGAPVRLLNEDGNKILRQASADGYEVRIGGRGNFCSKAPIWNANVKLSAV